MKKTLVPISICLLAVCLVMPADAAKGADIIPYAVGNTWQYTVTEVGVMSFGEGMQSRSAETNSTGNCTVEVLEEKERRSNGDVVYLERDDETDEGGLNTGPENIVTESLTMISEKGLFGLGHRSSGPDGELDDEWVSYDPPLVLFPENIEVGKNWKMGTLREDNIRIPMAFQVLDSETVTVPAGTFENCMKICGTSAGISGTIGSGEDQAKIRKGMNIHTMWIYPGVGIVREQIISQIKMALRPSGSDATVMISGTRKKTKELQPGYVVK